MEELLRAHLIDLAGRFEAATGVTERTIGKRALNDNTFFARLHQSGAGFNVRTYDRLLYWFSANWPAGEPWPKRIDPAATPASGSAPAGSTSDLAVCPADSGAAG